MSEKLRAGDIWLVAWPYRHGSDEDGRTIKDRPAIVVRHWLYGPRLIPLTSQEKRRDQEGFVTVFFSNDYSFANLWDMRAPGTNAQPIHPLDLRLQQPTVGELKAQLKTYYSTWSLAA